MSGLTTTSRRAYLSELRLAALGMLIWCTPSPPLNDINYSSNDPDGSNPSNHREVVKMFFVMG
jgi:hypothetical protein